MNGRCSEHQSVDNYVTSIISSSAPDNNHPSERWPEVWEFGGTIEPQGLRIRS